MRHIKFKVAAFVLACGIVSGCAFAQNANNLSRAEFAGKISDAFKVSAAADISRFGDVKKGGEDYEAVSKAYAMKIISGVSAEVMSPDSPITFEQACAIVGRAFLLESDKDLSAAYKFKEEISPYAMKYVAAIIEKDGDDGALAKIEPKAKLNAEIFGELMKIAAPNTVSDEDSAKNIKKGSVLLTAPINLKGVKIDGDLVISDALSGEEITLEDCNVSGRLIIRGGNVRLKNTKVKTEVTLSGKVIEDSGNTDASAIKYGDANVDQRNYPRVSPFIHPPFYNVRVGVKLDDSGKITEVFDDNTAEKGRDPLKTKEMWEKKNGKFFNLASENKFFDKFKGKTLKEVAEMKTESGEIDALTGATETGRAIKEAVMNALEGKKGKVFLGAKDELRAVNPVLKTGENTVKFENRLPKDFKVSLLSICHTVYNGEETVPAADYEWKRIDGGFELIFKKSPEPGFYYVNTVDESGKYRSLDFESGHGSEPRYGRFVVESANKLVYENGKISVKDCGIDSVIKNIEDISILEKDMIGKKIKNEKGEERDYSGIEIEPVGHHGTADAAFKKAPLINSDGSINFNAVYGRKAEKIFKPGKTYVIEIKTYGFGDLKFETEALSEKISEVKKQESGNEKTVESSEATSFGYDVRLRVKIDGEKIISVEDNGTDAGQSTGFFKKSLVLLGKMKGLDKAGVKALDSVSGATESSRAIKSAVLKAFK